MKKVLGVVLVSVLLLAGGTCFAQGGSGVYVKGIGKYVMPSDPEIGNLNVKSDNGYGLGVAVGMTFNQFRVEGEISTQKTDIDAVGILNEATGMQVGSGDVRMDTYMINGYFDIPVSDGFGVYLMGGLGYGTSTVSIYNIDGDDSGFAWKGGAGVFYTIDDNMAVDLGWEYVTMDDADLSVKVKGLDSNNIVAAFRYTF